jgi:RNA polymerase sigma factor (TIGR02999 family)
VSDVTRILTAIDKGDTEAAKSLLPLVYDELRKLAAQRMAKEAEGHTLQATDLVHEAYLRLVGTDTGSAKGWDSRGHFFAAAAEAMRRILIDHARAKGAVKRGGSLRKLKLDASRLTLGSVPAELLDLDESLGKLGQEDPIKAELVKLRFFTGLTLDEAAKVLGISPATADRYWSYARAWLYAARRPRESHLADLRV